MSNNIITFIQQSCMCDSDLDPVGSAFETVPQRERERSMTCTTLESTETTVQVSSIANGLNKTKADKHKQDF